MLRALAFVHLAQVAQAARIQMDELLAAREDWQSWTHKSKKHAVWKYICNGNLKGNYRGRAGYGFAAEDWIGKKKCMQECQKLDRCNLITYDKGTGKCSLENLPPQQRKVMEVMPRASDCDSNSSAWAYWYGDPMATYGLEEPPEGWHLFCNGDVTDESTWKTSLGKASKKRLGKAGCMKACAKVKDCNFVTYDVNSGTCMMENLNHLPEQCDENDAAWSYALNVNQEIEHKEYIKEPSASEGWHFICSGFVIGKYEGRRGLGQASGISYGDHVGCKEACDETPGCNFVTYDTWTGTCWLERIPKRPNTCNKHSVGWSYWKRQ